MKYILDSAGEPVPEPDVMTWATWLANNTTELARDQIGGITITTSFIAVDSIDMFAPLLFEVATTINGITHRFLYRTRADAIAAHVAYVETLQTGGGETNGGVSERPPGGADGDDGGLWGEGAVCQPGGGADGLQPLADGA